MRRITMLSVAFAMLAACERADTAREHTATKPAEVRAAAPTAPPAPAPKAPEVAPTPVEPAPTPAAIEPLGLDNDRVIEIAATAREIEASPDHVDAILEGHRLDRLTFEAAITEIAKDPWKSDLYIAALEQAPRG